MRVEFAERVKRIPPYLFAELEKVIAEKKRMGVRLISLSIGDPDLPPPPFILEALREEASNPENHGYSTSRGELEFREAVAEWYKKRFNVDLNPEKEVTALIGSKEGIANIARAFVNPGDKVLVPDPAYPVYRNGATLLSDGFPVVMPLLEERKFKPDLEALDDIQAKIMFLNYPNNPTGAVVDRNFLKEVVEFAREKNIILCYDNAYSETTFDGYVAPSILEIDGAMEVAVEFHSCSKMFNMTGYRIAFAVGNEHIITGLLKVKTQIDSGPPIYIQKVAIKALRSYVDGKPPEYMEKVRRIYAERRDIMVERLKSMGFNCEKPKATFYIWLNCGCSSMDFTSKLLEAGVVVTPGIGFGEYGENYVRISLTRPKDEIEEACRRIAETLQ